MLRRRLALFVAVFCLLCLAPRAWSAPPSARAVESLAVPDQGLQPQALVDAAGTLHLIYFKGTPAHGDLYYVRRPAGATDWSAPLRVNSQPESAIATGTIRGGQLALGRNSRVHVAWNGSQKATPKAGGKYPSPMLYARLDDSGQAFEPQRNLMQDGTALDGGGCVAADPDGRVYVVWHALPLSGGQGEADRRVYVAASTDDGQTFAREQPVDVARVGVCGCCGLKATADARGVVSILYRSAQDAKNRDMHLLTSTDHGATFHDQFVSPWSVVNCPMSSAAFAHGPKGAFAAWETNGQVSFASLGADSERLGRPLSPSGAATGRRHPALAVNRNGRVLLVWTEGTGWQRGGSFAWQEFDAQGKPTSVKGREPGVPVWSFATAVALPDGRFAIIH